MNEIFLTIVIPAYNEAARLPESLARLQEYLERVAWPTEVIVVDDGSTDGTAAVLDTWTQRLPGLRLVQRPHQGKGGAVRAGILAATGEYVAIADADFSMPVEQFDRFHASVVGPYDLAIGSREAAGARRFHEPLYRHLMGRVFNGLVRALLLPGIQDTQCGFKWIRRAVAVDLSQHQTIYG